MSNDHPHFKIPIEDIHVARFWLNEWTTRFIETWDNAFKEQAAAMLEYIDRNFNDAALAGVLQADPTEEPQ